MYSVCACYIVEGKRGGRTEVTERQGRRSKQLQDKLKTISGYWKFKENALDGLLWEPHFARRYGSVIKTDYRMMKNDVHPSTLQTFPALRQTRPPLAYHLLFCYLCSATWWYPVYQMGVTGQTRVSSATLPWLIRGWVGHTTGPHTVEKTETFCPFRKSNSRFLDLSAGSLVSIPTELTSPLF
jgi:hypothetical protein